MQRCREFTASAIDLARNAPSIAAPASVRVQNAMRVACYESVLHIASSAADKPYGTGAFEVLGEIFSAGALAVARSPHVVQLPRLCPRRTRES